MLLRLIPLQEPTVILVSLTFADLPQNVNTPPAWASQLSHLVVEDLEVPSTVHSLDKAAGITSLLEQVTFDIPRQEVRCKFVEGCTEEWGFHESGRESEISSESGFSAGQVEGKKLLAVLEGIVRDVKASTEEDERTILERDKHRQRIMRSERSKSVTSKSGAGKVLKHKKQRSMFMQIVSSIGSTIASLTSPSSSNSLPSRLGTTLSASLVYTNLGQYPLSQSPPRGRPETTSKARALRRAARVALVDAYRRFVLRELTRRLPAFSYRDANGIYQNVYGGGFCMWILHSMRRRAQERIDQLFEEAQVVLTDQAYDSHGSLSEGQQVPEEIPREQIEPQPETDVLGSPDRLEAMTTAVVPPAFDDDGGETATETDGSSLHTPSSGSHLNCFLLRPPTSASSHSQAPSSSDVRTECQEPIKELDPSFLTTPSPTPPSSPTSPTFLKPSSPGPDSIPSPMAIFPSRPTSSTLSQNLSGAALLEYNELIDLRERLWQLAMFAESQNRIAAEEVRNRLEVLTVRSRRRAWSAGQFRVGCGDRAGCRANVAFSGQYGFSMPFRSSPLARFSWTAEDLEKEFEREPEIASSSNVVSAVAGYPSFLRPSNFAQGEIGTLGDIHVEDEQVDDSHPLVDGEFELYEEYPGPSPLDLRGRRGRRHSRRRDLLEMAVDSGSMHRLFPVSEELEGEGEEAVELEFRVALGGGIAAYGPIRGRRMERTGRTFMGCDEIAVDDDEDEEKFGHSQETLIDDDLDADLVDPRELDIELGFGFDFHQKDGGRGFLGDEDLFDQDEDDGDDEDEDEFKFDLSSQLERPKIRPRVRTSSIFMPRDIIGRPLKHKAASTGGFRSSSANFASSSHNLPLYTPLSKSPPFAFPPRSVRTAAPQLSDDHLVLDISRTTRNEPAVAEIEIRLVDEPIADPSSSTHPLNSHHPGQIDLWRSVTANAHVMKSLPAAPLPIQVPLEIGVHDDGPEEFTLAMDLPRTASGGGGGNGTNSTHGGSTGRKQWMRHTPAAQGNPGRSLHLKLLDNGSSNC